MAKNRKTPDMNLPVWFDGQNINEALFCEEFLHERRIIFANGAFFTPDGRVTDDLPLRGEIYDKLKFCAVNNIPRKITNILEVLKLEAQVPDFPPEQDRIHVFNGTLLLNGTFTEGRPAIVRSRLPVVYNPDAPAPVIWLNFLNGLLHAEDIPTLQEFIGYCLIPSNKGQRMMVIKGNGGEGKSQIGAVLSAIFGTNMKDGSIGKISENRFARADLEHILLCVDDDMRMEALRQTNYVKSIVTAQGKMDLERKGKQSYQGWMFARLLAFSNGDLQALYDRSDGFYRRQLVLTTKEKPVDRADDPDLAEKMKAEAEGIFLWAFEGLQRLVANNFKFTESDRIRENREAVKRDNNNIFDFMDSEGYIRRKADASISSKDFYEIYRMWCEENSLAPLKARSFSDAMIANAKKFNLEHCNNIGGTATDTITGAATALYKARRSVTVTGAAVDTYKGAWTIGAKSRVSATINGSLSLIAKASSTLQFKSRVNVNIKGNLTRTVKGKVTDTITGDVKQSIKGDVQQKIDGDAKLEVTGNLEVKVGGTTIKATSGGNVTVTAAATCTVNSPIVTIEGGTGDVKVNGISLVHHKHKDGGQGEPEK